MNPHRSEKAQDHRRSKTHGSTGQAVALFAVIIPVTVLFALGIFDYMVTTARVMETMAAADLGAHAGAQVVRLQPDGRIVVDNPSAQATAAAYFEAQAPSGAVLLGVVCRLVQDRPACLLTASVPSAGFLIPEQTILVEAVGELAYGATRDNQ